MDHFDESIRPSDLAALLAPFAKRPLAPLSALRYLPEPKELDQDALEGLVHEGILATPDPSATGWTKGFRERAHALLQPQMVHRITHYTQGTQFEGATFFPAPHPHARGCDIHSRWDGITGLAALTPMEHIGNVTHFLGFNEYAEDPIQIETCVPFPVAWIYGALLDHAIAMRAQPFNVDDACDWMELPRAAAAKPTHVQAFRIAMGDRERPTRRQTRRILNELRRVGLVRSAGRGHWQVADLAGPWQHDLGRVHHIVEWSVTIARPGEEQQRRRGVLVNTFGCTPYRLDRTDDGRLRIRSTTGHAIRAAFAYIFAGKPEPTPVPAV